MAEKSSSLSLLRQRKKYRQLALPGASVVLAVLLTFGVLVPQVKQAIADTKEVQNLRSRLSRISRKAALLASLDTNELEARSQRLRAAIPSSKDLGYFISGVKSMGRRTNAVVGGVELLGSAGAASQSEVRQGENVVRLSVDVRGTMEAVNGFLYEVEHSVPLTRVEDILATSGGSDGEVQMQVTLNYFYSLVPETIGTAEEPVNVITAAEEQVYEELLEFSEPEKVEFPRVETGNADFIL